jgi:uncharacterized protein (TIGR03086 family)
MDTADLDRATAAAAAVMAKLTPDQLDASTPCATWKVRDIINHVVGGTYFFTAIAETGAPPQGGGDEAPDFAAGDFNAAYAEGRAKMLAAFAGCSADTMMDFGFMKVPGPGALNIATTDTLAHVWDLARAIGEPTDVEPDLATRLLENAKVAIPESFRGEDGKAAFGPIVEVPASAPPADQLAGFLGRRV